MDRAASMSPGSVSASALSTCLEKKGTVPIIRGTMAPGTLMAVPMMALDRGMTHVSRMINGMERKKLISLSKIWYSTLFSRMPPGFVTTMIIPNMSPSTKAMLPDQATITRVSLIAARKSGSLFITLGMILFSSSAIFDYLHSYIFLLQVGERLLHLVLVAADYGNRTANRRILYDFHICEYNI